MPDFISGLDLSAAVLGLSKGPDYVFSLRSTPAINDVPFAQMVRSNQFKLIRYAGGEDREFTFYDIINDRFENNNLINNPAYSDIITTHKNALKDFMDSLRYSDFSAVRVGSGK